MLKSATMSIEMMPDIEPDDAMCKICLEIYVEPITMPCQHRLCKVRYLNKHAPIERAIKLSIPCKIATTQRIYDHLSFKVCFEKNYDQTSMHCPFCKKRLGIWKRRAKDVNECKLRNDYLSNLLIYAVIFILNICCHIDIIYL